MSTVIRRSGKIPGVTDRERILLHLIERLYLSQPRYIDGQEISSEFWKSRLAYFGRDKTPQARDLVYITSGSIDKFRIAWFMKHTEDGFLVREIGSGRLCEWTNATAVPIVGLNYEELLEGEEYRFFVKLMRVFAGQEFYGYRYGGIVFSGNAVTVTIREAHSLTKNSTPFTITFRYSPRMSVKKIRQALVDGGYGTRSFRPAENAS